MALDLGWIDLTPKIEKLLKAARDLYADDDINIDDDAVLSIADEHVWVSAWVRVPLPLDNHEAS